MISVRWCNVDEVDDSLYQSWTELGLRATRSNLYAMPQFVLPASRWLTPRYPARIAVIEHRVRGDSELLGIGSFTLHRPTMFAPFQHLRCYRSRHTFQDSLLCIQGAEDKVACALLTSIARHMQGAQAIAMRNVSADDPLFTAMRERAGQDWYQLRALSRPVLHYSPDMQATTHVPRRVARDIESKHRRLEATGKLSFRVLQGACATDDVITRHLDIEHMGWKGAAGTSMRSSTAETAFFQDLCRRMRSIGSSVFSEILLDGHVIASASGFRIADTFNAFKTGHDPKFARAGPGKLNAMLLIQAIPTQMPDVRMFDSNSRDDSFIGGMLPDRKNMLAGFLPLNRFARRALKAARLIRPIAYRLDKDP